MFSHLHSQTVENAFRVPSGSLQVSLKLQSITSVQGQKKNRAPPPPPRVLSDSCISHDAAGLRFPQVTGRALAGHSS